MIPMSKTETLKIADLCVTIAGKQILHGVDLVLRQGETHALMGPNGSGKSTLGFAIMGHPSYAVTGGSIELGDRERPWPRMDGMAQKAQRREQPSPILR